MGVPVAVAVGIGVGVSSGTAVGAASTIAPDFEGLSVWATAAPPNSTAMRSTMIGRRITYV